MPTYIITADSKPDFDSWGPDDYWSCDDWIFWHKKLKEKFGKDQADLTWINAWNSQGGTEHNYNWCKYGGSFNDYVRDEKLGVSWVLPNLLNDAAGLINSAGSSLGNVGDLITNVTKVLKWAIPALVIVASIGVLIYGYKKIKLA